MSVESAVTVHDGRPERSIEIFVNDIRYEVHARELTGAQIATLGDVPDGNQIFLEVPGPGDDLPIGRHEAVELRPGMRFYDVPVGSLG